MICSNIFLFFNGVGELRNMFVSNGCTLWFFKKYFKNLM